MPKYAPRERIMDRVECLTRARPKSPTLATTLEVMRIFEDLHWSPDKANKNRFSERSRRDEARVDWGRRTHVSMDDGWSAGVKVLKACRDVEHEAELSGQAKANRASVFGRWDSVARKLLGQEA
jgi:hypothetical protein